MEEITKRWYDARKINGQNTAVTLPDGAVLQGRYILCDCGSFTPSHDALNGFCLSPGFPVDNGQSVNDRDYMRDKDAQRITREIAQDYDARAITSPITVSKHGVVLSGNGRTMAGVLAAKNGTDGKYIAYLQQYAGNYGLLCEDVMSFEHPRIVVELCEDMEYSAQTFARFNAQDIKTMSKTEEAVKLGKLVNDALFNRIVSVIAGYDTLSELYADMRTSMQLLNELEECGVINKMQKAAMIDGSCLSVHGKDLIENILVGKAFCLMPDAVRMITSIKTLRRSVVCGLSEAVLSVSLGNGYDLKNELSAAVKLAYDARNAGYKDGEKVSIYARQMTMFGDNESVSDYRNKPVLLLADALNDRKETYLRKILAVYNSHAKESAAGQTSMFGESPLMAKGDIMQDVVRLFSDTDKEEQASELKNALNARKDDALAIVCAPLTVGNYANVDLGGGVIAIGRITKKTPSGYFLDFGGHSPAFFAKRRVSGTPERKVILPTWAAAGKAIRHGDIIQVIEDIADGQIILRWVNGGYFDIDINMAVLSWQAA